MSVTNEKSACAALLRRYIDRYLRRAKAVAREMRGSKAVPPPTSMRQLAERLGWNKMSLVRWSTEEAPRNWRIPLGRIPLVAQLLELKPQEVDELMSLRLGELEAQDRWNEAVAAARWALDLADRMPPKGWVSQKLADLGHLYPYGLPGECDVTKVFRSRTDPLLEAEFERLEKELVTHFEDEEAANRANQSSAGDRRAALEAVARIHEARAAQNPARISRKVRSLVRRIQQESKRQSAGTR